MNFAKWVYRLAGIYGIIIIAPMYALESKLNIDYPPSITHPEYFYGFIGVTLAWQILFLVIARDPIRFRNAMPVAMFEKFSYVIAVVWLHNLERVSGLVLTFGFIDLLLGLLFLVAYIKTKRIASEITK